MTRNLLSAVLAAALLLATALGAVAWTNFGTFSGSNWWAPNSGEKWGMVHFKPPMC